MPCIRPISDLRNNANEISDFCRQPREPVYITRNRGHGGAQHREPGTHLSRVYCEYFSAKVFCYRLVKKAFLIRPYSHHRNSTELGEYLRDLIRLHSKLNVLENLRYLLMPSHKILFCVLVALENQPYPIKAAGCQILFCNIEIEEPIGCPHPILHLEQQRPTVMGGCFCPLTNLFWNLTPTIAQIVALGYHITFGKHTVLDHHLHPGTLC